MHTYYMYAHKVNGNDFFVDGGWRHLYILMSNIIFQSLLLNLA